MNTKQLHAGVRKLGREPEQKRSHVRGGNIRTMTKNFCLISKTDLADGYYKSQGPHTIAVDEPDPQEIDPCAGLCDDFGGAFIARVKNDDLIRAIRRSLTACSGESLDRAIRPALTGIWCEWEETGIKFVATDGHRLAVTTIKQEANLRFYNSDDDAQPQACFIIPAGAARTALKFLKKGSHCTLSLSDKADFFDIEHKEHRLAVTTINEPFPDWRRVVPESAHFALSLYRREVLQVMEYFERKRREWWKNARGPFGFVVLQPHRTGRTYYDPRTNNELKMPPRGDIWLAASFYDDPADLSLARVEGQLRNDDLMDIIELDDFLMLMPRQVDRSIGELVGFSVPYLKAFLKDALTEKDFDIWFQMGDEGAIPYDRAVIIV